MPPQHPTGAYYVQASCELSEDYFLTEDVLIGADDKVMPFVNSQNNMVEAVVLTHDSNGQPSLATCTGTRLSPRLDLHRHGAVRRSAVSPTPRCHRVPPTTR